MTFVYEFQLISHFIIAITFETEHQMIRFAPVRLVGWCVKSVFRYPGGFTIPLSFSATSKSIGGDGGVERSRGLDKGNVSQEGEMI